MQHHAIFRIQPLFHALQRLRSLTALPANAGHNTHTLRFDKDLALRTLFAAHRLAKGIVGAAEPCSVPASRQRGLLHGLNALAGSGRFLIQMQVVAQFGVLPAILDEHTGDEHALGYRTLAGAGDLKALTRVLGEAVQVQAVVPVGAANERQAVGAKVRNGEVEAAAQMFQQRLGLGLVIIERHLLIQDAPVSGLPQVGGSAGDEPQRVVVEASADVAVSLFGQRLILMVSTAILKLGGRNVQNALPCTEGMICTKPSRS